MSRVTLSACVTGVSWASAPRKGVPLITLITLPTELDTRGAKPLPAAIARISIDMSSAIRDLVQGTTTAEEVVYAALELRKYNGTSSC